MDIKPIKTSRSKNQPQSKTASPQQELELSVLSFTVTKYNRESPTHHEYLTSIRTVDLPLVATIVGCCEWPSEPCKEGERRGSQKTCWRRPLCKKIKRFFCAMNGSAFLTGVFYGFYLGHTWAHSKPWSEQDGKVPRFLSREEGDCRRPPCRTSKTFGGCKCNYFGSHLSLLRHGR